MDLIQIICYRLWDALLSVLQLFGLGATPPLYTYDSSECARDIETAVTLYSGTYRQAIDEVKKDPKRSLLLFFHSPQHPDSKLVKRQVLQDPAFAEYVTDLDGLVLFPVSIESFSGWQCTIILL